MTGLGLRPYWASLVALAAQACTPTPVGPTHHPPEPPPVATAPAPPAATAASTSTVPAPPAPLEDDSFVVGAPRDETAFEYDVERSDESSAPTLDGIPALLPSRVRALQPFLETRRAKLAGMNASGMYVLTRLGETTQVHRVESPLAMRRQLTFGLEPVEQVAALPGSSTQLLYRSDFGGNEDYQLFIADGVHPFPRMLTDGRSRNGAFRLNAAGQIAYTSNQRNGQDMDLHVRDLREKDARLVAELPGAWTLLALTPSGDEALMLEYRSATSSTLHRVALASGQVEQVLDPSSVRVVRAAGYAGGSDKLIVAAALTGDDHVRLYEIGRHGAPRVIAGDVPWDIDEMAISRNGRHIAYVTNEDGYSGVSLLNLSDGKKQRLGLLPKGVIQGIRFAAKDGQLAFTFSSATQPPNAYVYDLSRRELTQWTDSEVGGIRQKDFVNPRHVRITSFDGEEVPVFVYLPAGKGPFPVLIWMHGGPEEQFRPSFEPIIQYFAATRGVAVVAPNVRGSDGYGLRYLQLDDGILRHHAVQDVGAVLDFVDGEPQLDASRVGIHGASYGGFMVLAALVAYPSRIRAGCDVVGISRFVTFLENTSPYRRELRRAEYGDERHPDVRAYLENLSPLRHASTIKGALLVAHGANDPRVPLSEATQLVNEVRANGLAAWSFVARGEGHSFRKRRNRDAFYRVMADFFERFLVLNESVALPPPASEAEDDTFGTPPTSREPLDQPPDGAASAP